MAGHPFSYYPPGLYYAMTDLARKYDISVKEVETVLIRHALTRDFCFKCDHKEEKVKTNKQKKKTYCGWCWRRLEVLREPRTQRIINDFKFIPGDYKTLKTFLEPDEGLSENEWRETMK
jgi:hypothetical protein